MTRTTRALSAFSAGPSPLELASWDVRAPVGLVATALSMRRL
jgi:hypothetical protein